MTALKDPPLGLPRVEVTGADGLNEFIEARHGDAPMRNPLAFLRARRLIYLRDLLRTLVARDIKVRYKGSILGVAWSLVHPLLLLLVFHFLFRLVFPLNIPRYSTFTFSGLLVWTWFQSSMIQSAAAITGSRELIKWPGFPAAILPAITVTTNLVYFLLALPVLLLFLIAGGGGLKPTILTMPLLMLLQFMLTLGLAYLVATANVIFRDTQHIIGVLLQLLFFLSPVFYDSAIVPAPYQPLYRMNPLVHLIEGYRAVLIDGTLPDGVVLPAIGVLSAMLLYVGVKMFLRVSCRFIEQL